MAQSAALPNAEQLAGSWTQIKGKIREKWGQLSENDLERFKGDVDQLVGHVQQKTGQTRQDIEAYVAEISAGASGVMQKARDAASGVEGGLEFITQYPFSAVTTCFVLGFAVGVVGVLLLDDPPARRWYERIPDSAGRRWLESFLNSLPDSVRAKVS